MVIQIKKNSHLGFICLVALLVALLFVRYAFMIDIPSILLTAVIMVIAVSGNRDEVLAISFCCIPLHEAVDFYISLTVCALCLIWKGFRKVRIGLPIILFATITCWELLHCFSVELNLVHLLSSLIPLLFLVIILSSDVSGVDYPFIVRSVAVVSVAVCLMLLTNCIVNADFDIVRAILNLRRLGVASEDSILQGGAINPNTLGVINVLSATALLQLRSINRSVKADTVFIVLLILLGALTTSRTFFVCLLLMVFLLIMGQKGSWQKKVQFIFILLLIVVVVLLLMNWLFPSVLEYFIGRFLVDDITTGRDILMVKYHNFIVDNPDVMFFGIGLNDFGHRLVNVYHIAAVTTHNSIQEIIIAWGIPGLIMIAVLFIMMISAAKRYNSRHMVLNYIPFIIILAKSMAGQLLTSGYSILALAFAYLSLCQDFNPKTKDENIRL